MTEENRSMSFRKNKILNKMLCHFLKCILPVMWLFSHSLFMLVDKMNLLFQLSHEPDLLSGFKQI